MLISVYWLPIDNVIMIFIIGAHTRDKFFKLCLFFRDVSDAKFNYVLKKATDREDRNYQTLFVFNDKKNWRS